MRRRNLQNIPPCRATRATLLTTFFTIFILSLYPQPSSTSPIPIPGPATEQQTPFNLFEPEHNLFEPEHNLFEPEHNPFEPEHNRVVSALEPSNYPGSNPSEPNNTPGSTGTGSSTVSISNNVSNNSSSDDDTSQPRGLNWSHLSSVFVNEICKNDGRAILLGFLIGCLGTWLIHVLVQRYFLRRGWGVAVWPSRRTRRHWDSRRHGNGSGHGHGDRNGGGGNVLTGAGEPGPDERSSDPPRAEMGAI